LRISPATPRKDAADRYSPEIAPAFAVGPTVREATRKSEVLRANRTPNEPITVEATATIAMQLSATTAAGVMFTSLRPHRMTPEPQAWSGPRFSDR
jgi:hypothetical protein